VIKRSNVILYKETGELKRIGYTNGKNTQARAAVHSLGGDVSLIQMMNSALAYALECGEADGVVMDITGALKLRGQFNLMPLDYDEPTSVLAVKKDIVRTREFEEFLSLLNRCADELNRSAAEAVLGRYLETEMDAEVMEIWEKAQVTYLNIPNES
jgi:hypothetical protein